MAGTVNQAKIDMLIAEAIQARAHSHSPYSQKKIGASVLFADDSHFSGCNIENASYGGTVCAERVAIWSGIAQGAKKSVLAIAVASDAQAPWPPCGFCRQVLAEFGTADTLVLTCNPQGTVNQFTLGQLLPEAFTASHLQK